MNNYFIIGFMGAGKTTMGKMLEAHNAYNYYDLDDYIAQKYQMRSDEIIQKYSLEIFRNYEKETFFELIKKQNCILTLGGGSVTVPEIYEYLHKNPNVLYLKADIQTLYNRIKNDTKNVRPLAMEKTLLEVQKLFDSRKHLYEGAANYLIDANQNIDEVFKQVNKIIDFN